jgi:hypothetical protein
LDGPPFVFQALAVYVGHSQEARCFMVALADHAEHTDNAFVLMRPDELDQPDRPRTGDDYTLVTGSGKTHQGGVIAAVIGDDVVEFRLTIAAAAQLGIPDHFVIGIGFGNSTQVRGGLARVIGAEAVRSYA